MRGAFDELEVPVGFQGAQLDGAEEAELASFGQHRMVEDLGDGGVCVVRVTLLTPVGYPALDLLMEVGHWVVCASVLQVQSTVAGQRRGYG